jgi:hypothetical protein
MLNGMDVSSASLMMFLDSVMYSIHQCQTSSLRTGIHCLENLSESTFQIIFKGDNPIDPAAEREKWYLRAEFHFYNGMATF